MSVTYNITTNFAAKDSLPSNDPAKVVNGTDFSVEYNAIKDAFDECAPSESPTFTGDVTFPEGNLPVTGTNGQTLRYGTDWEATSDIVVDDNGNVGIGTTSQSSKLHVRESATVGTDHEVSRWQTSSGGNLRIYVDDLSLSNPTWRLQSNSGEPLSFGVGSYPTGEAMRIDANGNVGIGTDNPNSILEIADNTDTGPIFRLTDKRSVTPANGFVGGIEFYQNDASGGPGAGGYIYSHYANISGDCDLRFGTGGPATERMRIDSSGNVGIGTTRSNSVLNVEAADNCAHFTSTTSSGYIWLEDTGSTGPYYAGVGSVGDALRFRSGAFERMRIDSNGNVNIGNRSAITPSNVKGLTVRAVGGSSAVDPNAGGEWAGMVYHDLNSPNKNGLLVTNNWAASGSTVFECGSTDALNGNFSSYLKVDGAGNLIIGGDSAVINSAKHVLRDDGVSFHRIDAGGVNTTIAAFYNGTITAAGSISCSSTTTFYNTSSDERLKENIRDSDPALGKIDSIRVRQFDWKANGEHQEYGFIAQELIEVAPQAVAVPADEEEMMGVDYSHLVPLLVKSMQEQQQLITDLTQRVAELEA